MLEWRNVKEDHSICSASWGSADEFKESAKLQHSKEEPLNKGWLFPVHYNISTLPWLVPSATSSPQSSTLSSFPCRSLPRCHCPTSLCQSPRSPGCPAAWKASTMSWRRSSLKTMEIRRNLSPWRFQMGDEHLSLHSSAAAAPAVWIPRPPQLLAGPAAALAYHHPPRQPVHWDHMMAVLTPQMIYYMIEIKTMEAAHRCQSLPPHPNPTTAICSSGNHQKAVRRLKLLRKWAPGSPHRHPSSPALTKTKWISSQRVQLSVPSNSLALYNSPLRQSPRKTRTAGKQALALTHTEPRHSMVSLLRCPRALAQMTPQRSLLHPQRHQSPRQTVRPSARPEQSWPLSLGCTLATIEHHHWLSHQHHLLLHQGVSVSLCPLSPLPFYLCMA